jgi:5-formyltetrahydrofolate cyclo-ligase
MNNKANCRLIAEKRLTSLSNSDIEDNSKQVCHTLSESALDIQNLIVYSAIKQEIRLNDFLQENLSQIKRLAFPRFNRQAGTYEVVLIDDFKTDLELANYGILEPKPTLSAMKKDDYENFNWLVPGLAFTTDGIRLGRGKGFYDRLMQKTNGAKIAIAHNCQIMDEIPYDDNDVLMDYVITEKAFYSNALDIGEHNE